MKFLSCYGLLLLLLLLCFHEALSWSTQFNQVENYEGSSDLISLQYYMGPVLASDVNVYISWYGQWSPTHQGTIRDFIDSLSSSSSSSSSSSVPYPSVSDWWRTVRLYTNQTGSNITGTISLSGEFYDTGYSHGVLLSRLSMQSIIKTAVTSRSRPLPLNPRNCLYLVLTSDDVRGSQCPGMCAYPFAWPKYSGRPPPSNDIMRAPNGDAWVHGMIRVIAHELVEVSSNPLVNAWYAGDDPTAPTEIADLCLGLYGSGGGGGYVGKVYKDAWGNGYNVNGVEEDFLFNGCGIL
ncbi:Protein EXORDIUM-like 7 [Hibiscus syriacus]|uniref:Protein EXORDIUM-like 7 n=1 Tax=Hibiscus syriacus TaxID=106335 RepID=A0A6A2X8R2_HIBSY|nr:Protein EXORDIUM-like 7 [Hibiscus syriacus]